MKPLFLFTHAQAALLLLCLMIGRQAHAQRAPLDPAHTLGVESCRDCHDAIVKSWEHSAHSTSFGQLATTEAAQKIAGSIGIKPGDIATSTSCIRCHYTQEKQAGTVQTTAAVSCESCHGGADKWVDIHNSKSRSRAQRVESAMSLGMQHPASVLAAAQSCYECHVVDDEQLVNKAAHPALSEGFEVLSWYAGDVKHNFLVSRPGKAVKSNGKDPQPIPDERQRMLFLTGKLLHLAHSLGAIARSTDAPVDKSGQFIRLPDGRYTFAVQHALTVQRLLNEVSDLQGKLQIPEYAQAFGIAASLTLTTGHSEEISSAAKEITRLAEQFSKNNDGTKFAALDATLAKLTPKFSGHGTKVAAGQ